MTVFLGLTIVVMGFAAYMTGKALANTWKPLWQLFLYCLLLGLGDQIDSAFGYAEDNEWYRVSLIGGECYQFNAQPRDGLYYPPCVLLINDNPAAEKAWL